MLQVDRERTILHADLDAFFASVEQLDDPSLRGKPVLVGGRSGRGVVAAASYESRAFGCRSAMPMSRALALCPQAVVVGPRFGRYSELSGRFMAILGRFSPLVEALSVDEAFVDATGSRLLHGDGPEIARKVRAATRAELGLAVSVGVGPNKFVAKLASDMDKPDGLTVAPAEGLADWLAPLPIARMWGVGPRTLPRFVAAGVRTFGDLQRMEEGELRARLGDHAVSMRTLARGIDDRAVETEHERKGVGHETTFPEDLEDPELVVDALHGLVEGACRRLRASGGSTRRITVKIRSGDFETVTRSTTLDAETDSTLAVLRAAKDLFRRWAERGFVPVRLVGVRLERTAPGDGPATLFADEREERERRIDRVADAISRKFGDGSIGRGGAGRE
ncbi:MAG: DNA polymerase IV [Actinobacteria bacterium]|nr:DNA polymerase IV [Actinomycetota bacterium]